MLFKIISYLIVLIVTILFVRKLYKISETIYEKTLCIMLIIIIYTPIVIYYCDRYNVPSILHYTQNVNVNIWFNFLTNYIGTIIGTMISSLVVVLLAIKQIQIQTNETRENKRIENMPIFKYKLSNEIKSNLPNILIVSENDGKIYYLCLTIENIGLNHSKNVRYELYLNDNKIDYIDDKINGFQSFIKKDEKVELNFLFIFKYYKNTDKNNKRIKIVILYEDMLGNNYRQRILTDMTITNTFVSKCGGYKADYTNINIGDEELKSGERKC